MKKRVLSDSEVRKFNEHLMEEERSAVTIEKYNRDIAALRRYSEGKEITKELVIAYKQHLIESGYAERSINSMLARRIWANGLQFCQRDDGGAGTNTCVTQKQPVLQISGYEASWCCTMRYAEALLCWHKNREMFTFEPFAPVVTA